MFEWGHGSHGHRVVEFWGGRVIGLWSLGVVGWRVAGLWGHRAMGSQGYGGVGSQGHRVKLSTQSSVYFPSRFGKVCTLAYIFFLNKKMS